MTRRVLYRSFTQTELWPETGNRESLRKALFTKDSIIRWMLTSYGRNRKKYLAVMDSPEYEHIRFVRLRSPREAARFLAGMSGK